MDKASAVGDLPPPLATWRVESPSPARPGPSALGGKSGGPSGQRATTSRTGRNPTTACESSPRHHTTTRGTSMEQIGPQFIQNIVIQDIIENDEKMEIATLAKVLALVKSQQKSDETEGSDDV